ncbi:MAG: phosphate signaling complex protein PhoU [Bacteroidetes bacterium]|nr:phosphate signaling complex protein PhoU [Bacteroidota bacterium]MCW5896509.1 phosphate signaling complex protein PhoU [Bacteroidota bacterium]
MNTTRGIPERELMHRHFEYELDGLKSNIIKIASLAEQSIAQSIKSLLEQKKEIARQVIEFDKQIDAYEIVIDNHVVDILALQQPVAVDLRFILAASKINNDLERIGDHAVNIAQSAIVLADAPYIKPLVDIPVMADTTKQMLRDAIDAFIHRDAQKARRVLENDDMIDNLNKKIVNDLVVLMRKDQSTIDQALDLIRVSRNLERVADLTTNIAEQVIFMAEARVVKHQGGHEQTPGEEPTQ